MKTFSILAAAFVLASSTQVHAVPGDDDDGFCEHDGIRKCSPAQYEVFKNQRCEKSCISVLMPPPEPLVFCQFLGGMHRCTVWPRGDELSYTYAVSPGLDVSPSGPTYSSEVWIGCPMQRPGTLVVTVTSPYGLSSSTAVSLPCRATMEP